MTAKPNSSDEQPLRLALLWRGDPDLPPPDPASTRFRSLFAEAAACGLQAEPVVYADERADDVAARLREFDGVVVWVNPGGAGADRSRLDPMLRRLAADGLWVSAHPDVIMKMGVKAVLERTRSLGWGVDTHLYADASRLRADFPERLAGGPRVLKPNRGNDGIGVWRVRLAEAGAAPETTVVEVLAAKDDFAETLSLADFIGRLEPWFEGGAPVIDQPLQPRIADGMVRCYMAQNRVAGFSEQAPRSRAAEAPASAETFAMASAKVMRDAAYPAYAGLRRDMETDWVPGLQRLLDIATDDLPALWDADFLYGPKAEDGSDSFVLCEINVSAVAPFPESAAPAIIAAVAGCLGRTKSINVD